LVNNLKDRNISDEYFDVADSIELPKNFSCEVAVKQKVEGFYDELAATYNVTTCDSKVITNSSCVANSTTIECYECVTVNLEPIEKYEETRLHASAVSSTIIDYAVWKYFSISPRVKELVNEAKAMEDESLGKCKSQCECVCLKRDE